MDLAAVEAGFVASGMPGPLANALLAEYVETKRRFHLGDHLPTEVQGGRFAEAALRVIEHDLFGQATAIGKTLPQFNARRLAQFEGATSPHESLRIHIPRALFSVFAIRNKRDAAHLGDGISPNLQDSTYVVAVLDWVLAEFVRIHHRVSAAEAQSIIDNLVTREVPIIEEIDGQPVCLADLGVSDRILVFLYRAGTQVGLPMATLQQQMMHPDRSNLAKAVKKLAERKLVLIHPVTKVAHLTGLGVRDVQERRLLNPG